MPGSLRKDYVFKWGDDGSLLRKDLKEMMEEPWRNMAEENSRWREQIP